MNPTRSAAFLRASWLGCLLLLPALAQASVQLEVFPNTVHLRHKKDTQGLVVRVTKEDGLHQDVTAECQLSLEDPSKAALDRNLVLPKGEGVTKLKIQWKNLSTAIPVTVETPQRELPISFRNDVMPVLMKAECNRCHGAARGQDGFRLSLWGFDPEGDHFRLTKELPGRRVNLAVPEESMVLTKADGEAPHTGGKKFEKGSPLYKTLLEWLQAGAPNDPANIPQLTGVTVMPESLVLEGPGQSFRLSVRASFSDGTSRDVTSTALFLSSNEGSAKINPE